EEAISLWKRFFTQYTIDDRIPPETPFIDLETLFAKRMAAVDEDNPSDWVLIRGMIADGKYAYRNDNCFWVESLEDLPDSEIKYYVCCYGDYEGARDYHENIVLTMEHTIAQGDPYCSRVMHDTCVDFDLRHPPKKFWDNMWPVGKYTDKKK
ncbi:MAG: L-2-amino-thiazoline-4-carboxylic acid hydrolase, partial [Candidatus Thorarchaeota archaeon]|nr:L-2-amino-thiazoline-4-carboxylic acid hydrolase [Candidatus Thorarchaeota archaeon]